MSRKAAQKLRLGIFCFVAVIILDHGLTAAGVSLSGLSEGSRIYLGKAAPSTNVSLSVTAPGATAVAFSLERQGQLTSTFTSAAPASVTLSNLVAGKYFLAARNVSNTNEAADIAFDIQRVENLPANDSWSNAVAISVPGTSFTATNTGATTESGEPEHGGIGAGHSVWWKWQATSNGPITVTTAGSSFDTVLAVYSGTNVARLSLIGANDDVGMAGQSSQVSFQAVAGVTYSIAVDGTAASLGTTGTGAVQLRLLAQLPPTITIVSPTNGAPYLCLGATDRLNVEVNATITDTAGIDPVEWRTDGAGTSHVGTVTAPYQWNLSNLGVGDYLLSISAVSVNGLVHCEHVAFSIEPLAGRVLLVDSAAMNPDRFQFAVTGRKGNRYELQASTNVLSWSPLARWTNFHGAERVADTNAPQYSARFYRVINQ